MSIHQPEGAPVSQHTTPGIASSGPPPPNRKILPQPIYVPTRGRHRPDKLPPIYLNLNGAPLGWGVPLQELLARGAANALQGFLADCNDEALPEFKAAGINKIQLRVEWPGYEELHWMRPLSLRTSTGWMTKGQLIFQLGTLLQRFMNLASLEKPCESDKRFVIGRGQIGMQHVVLDSLINTYGVCFQLTIQLALRV
ncbi:hypothetical protein NLI96_g4326 [Meripilus lineatus]|uniref:Uncharacterized protein n=1 Tax=Meripilus lineatus TaxID=2056292 RepID=A0AAD5V525_9APHY|nr:hypothetical protein NLI96_g4326 [Physisporinus lineatus]